MKWVYIEDRSGCLLAKEYCNAKQAFDILKAKGWNIATKQQSDWCIVYRIN